ncbi:Dual serine/threonine and tyrosine protein kinase, partial [Clarias magur]
SLQVISRSTESRAGHHIYQIITSSSTLKLVGDIKLMKGLSPPSLTPAWKNHRL